MGKAFEKQIQNIEDQGEKQIKGLEELKPKEQTKTVEGKSNNQSRAAIIFDDIINKRKKILNELYENVDTNKLHFGYVGLTQDVR